jgi:Tol biopolymer transport system component
MKTLALLTTIAAGAVPPVAAAPGLVVSHGGKVYVEGTRLGLGTDPRWSPDGSRIAFVRYGEVHVADADGSNDRKLTVRKPGLHWPASSPTWSPDGTRIAFTGTRDVFIVRIADRRLTNLTRSDESWRGNFTPSFSPDGKLIAFSRSTTAFNNDIFVMRANGTGLRRLTKTVGTDGRWGEEHGPAWSPDGRRLVYVSNRDGNWELYTIGLDGSRERRLTRTRELDENAPRFTADGSEIVYSRSGRIALMNANGADVRELGGGTSADLR